MKKKIALIFMLLFGFSFALTGCNLYQTNYEKYYNQTVISIEYENGEKIEINKKQLITAFNSYGATLVSEQSYTIEDALEKTISSLINQQVLLKESETKVTLTNADLNSVWNDSYDAIMANMDSFADEVKTLWNIEEPEDTETESDTSSFVYSPYQKTASLVYENGSWVIRVDEEDVEDENQPLEYTATNYDAILSELKDRIIAKTTFTTTNTTLTPLEEIERQNARIYNEAYKKYIKTLISNEQGMNLSTDEQSVFLREVKRIYDNRLDSVKVTKMRDQIYYDTTLSKVTVDDVLAKYKDSLLESYTKYYVSPTSLSDDMLNSFSSVNYTSSQDYFFVSHILLKFDEVTKNAEGKTQKDIYDELLTKKANGTISPAEYEIKLTELINQIKVVERDYATGEEVTSNYATPEALLLGLNAALTNAKAISDEVARKQAINQVYQNFLYRFNQDEGALNSEYLYVIGKDDSSMVETFTDAARELFDNGNGTYGSTSGLVESTYGVHILFYAGNVSEYFPIQVVSPDHLTLTNDDVKILDDTLLNPLNNKTLFDKIYSSITLSESSANESMYLNVLKKDLKITKYVSAYKDLLG